MGLASRFSRSLTIADGELLDGQDDSSFDKTSLRRR
jgi:hypothetical protein